MKRLYVLLAILALTVLLIPFRAQVLGVVRAMRGGKTVADRVREYGPAARKRMAPWFAQAGVVYPPAKVALIGLKAEEKLLLYAVGRDRRWRFIHTFPILGASGVLGPKLREGDMQVPEGIYRIESLNPNSAYHLSLHVNYPNDFDRAMAKNDKRTALGGDIMIHGNTCSIGCLAMGDPAVEELFVLAADVGLHNLTVLLCPLDFRRDTATVLPHDPVWIETLYRDLHTALSQYPPPAEQKPPTARRNAARKRE